MLKGDYELVMQAYLCVVLEEEKQLDDLFGDINRNHEDHISHMSELVIVLYLTIRFMQILLVDNKSPERGIFYCFTSKGNSLASIQAHCCAVILWRFKCLSPTQLPLAP